MDCERARTEMGADRGDDPAVLQHLRGCGACREASARAAGGAALLERGIASDDAEPDPQGVARVVDTVLARAGRGGRRRSARSLAAVAAAALLAAGFFAGRRFPVPPPTTRPSPATISSAAHEREVFGEVAVALGDELAWAATVDGVPTLGFGPARVRGEMRVLFLELHDAAGRVLARPRVVLPDDEEVRVTVNGLPQMTLLARRGEDGRIDVRMTLEFEDGAALSANARAPSRGATVEMGEVRTRGAPVAVYAAAH